MEIGEKIKSLRLAKVMTQSELAGDEITRNMLSRIEHGAANPSLQTIQYLATRLNVPAGFLLAGEGDDFLYKKLNSIANIRHAYAEGDWGSCLNICESVFGSDRADDEVAMILTYCHKGVGAEEFSKGQLHAACRSFDSALRYTSQTVYDTRLIRAEIIVYFAYLRELSPLLNSDYLDETDVDKYENFESGDEFCRYAAVLKRAVNGRTEQTTDYLDSSPENSLFAAHIRAKNCIAAGDYEGGLTYLKSIMSSDLIPTPVLLYNVVSDLENCCRETGDYKGAYEYARDKLGMRERLLEDN